MAKPKKPSGKGPISKKVLSSVRKSVKKKVIDFSDLKDAKVKSDDLEKTIISEKKLTDLDPLHGVYVYAQNKMSVLVEQLSELRELHKITQAYVDAEDMYMPSGPPMSPLTASYFSCWGFFDLYAGIKKESFGTVVIDLCKSLNVDQGLIRLFEIMQRSRMGFFVHEGLSDRCVLLRELITEKQIRAIVPSGYMGNSGEIWLTRIFPEPFKRSFFGYSVVFITPYIIGEVRENKLYHISNENGWLEFFERNLHRTGIKERIPAYEFFMKYGLDRTYWNEYILESYVNYQHDMIFLRGFPDIPLSRPHSKEGQELMDT